MQLLPLGVHLCKKYTMKQKYKVVYDGNDADNGDDDDDRKAALMSPII